MSTTLFFFVKYVLPFSRFILLFFHFFAASRTTDDANKLNHKQLKVDFCWFCCFLL